jgi:EAL domain-containing protein (putative c-di-GMP-specific phosphodiesterase class I)
VSRASKAEWTIARRTMQFERAREQLNQEVTRSRSATDAARIAEMRLHLLIDALPNLILYVDRDERCRNHNKAAENKTGRTAEQISGQLLSEVMGSAYAFIAPHIPKTLEGKPLEYEFAWSGTALPETYTARHIPYPPEDPKPRGFYLLVSSNAASRTAVKKEASAHRAVPGVNTASAIEGETGESTLYLRSIADELMGWDDPKAKLEHAIKENQFLLFAQKILPLRDGLSDPLCYEVLLRLREEEDNLLPPGGFIPTAERYGMMEEIDRWVVRNLIRWCLELKRRTPPQPVPLYCINLSEDTIRSTHFAGFLRKEVEKHGFNARSLCFEIGEPDIIGQHENVERLINTLKPLGCRFTVDSFGSVKVSFTHLKGLAVDFIKIDGVIIQNILRDPAELAKARAINTVCAKVGLRTIAEFVERKETLDKLRALGVDYVQGFGVALPGPIDKQF